ncbi:MAG: helix-turn-helix domain-containing protein [Clostridium sp.]|nr:helix-turn-helix domain-containing protein [Clostridium sp.]MDU7082341.1 helix-turn-helix domain-containing protein [Clostridium sp.]
MEFLIGKQIKALRNEKGVTQEELASFLGISYQAVSKWENGATAPDIQLLPELSVYFGVTIDELFKLTNEDKLKRIDSLIENERYISEEKFLETEKFLLDLLKEDRKSSKALYLLAELYNHKGDRAKETAAEYAKKALEIGPNEKHYHTILIKACNGAFGDSYCNRHKELINYYKKFISENKDSRLGLVFYFDQLMDDRRLSEAEEVLNIVKELGDHVENLAFEGDIEFAKGNIERAIELWTDNVEKFKENSFAYFIRAEKLVNLERYEEAIKDFKTALDKQEKPRYPEMAEALAQAYEIKKEYDKAIEANKEKLKILKEDYGILNGELVDEALREIKRLKAEIRS